MFVLSRLLASATLLMVAGLYAAPACAEPAFDLKARVAVEQGWLDALPEGFAIRDAVGARDLRLSGAAERLIYVLSRERGAFRVLTVTDAARRADPAAAERVVAALESARRWIETRPDEAADLLVRNEGMTRAAARERIAAGAFNTARPGPALVAFLKSGADAARVSEVDAMVDEAPIRAAAGRAVRGDSLTALR